MNPGTENLLFGKHTSMYGKGTTISKGCYMNTQLHGVSRCKKIYAINCTVIMADECKCYSHEVASMSI